MRGLLKLCVMTAAIAAAACGVHQSSSGSATGPSEFATSLSVSASPDTINRDGSSQAVVIVSARNSNGQPLPGLALRLDTMVNGVVQDFGNLSARNLVTGAD